jgi:DNA polymerase-1
MLVDGHSVAFRAYYALPDTLRDASGAAANAVYGFLNILFRVLTDQRPSHLVVTFDLGEPFRVALYPGYKATREMGPEDLEPQVEKLRRLLAVLHIPVCELEGFEADDLLATLALQAGAHALQVDVLSGDLDVLQLVRDGVRVLAPGKTFAEPVIYDAARVVERFGVTPVQLRDWKALVGDASDEIPGVRGIGKKTATELVQRHGSLAAIYAHLHGLESARVRNALAAGRHDADLSYRLVTLRDDAPVTLDLATARLGGFEHEAAVRAVHELGFRGLAGRIPHFD